MAATPVARIEYDDEAHAYRVNGEPVPSVTQILAETCPKDALTWWGFRVGMAAAVEMLRQNKISFGSFIQHTHAEVLECKPNPENAVPHPRDKSRLRTVIEDQAIKLKLDTNNVKDKAADRGTLIHDAINRMGISDELPNIADFAPEHRGYIQALSKWWLEQDPEFVAQEVLVGSAELGYAGRLDLLARISDQLYLIDFKTSKAIYSSHEFQLQGYMTALLETDQTLGDDVEHMAVVRLGADGSYEMKTTTCSPSLWRAHVQLWKSLHADGYIKAPWEKRARKTDEVPK